MRELQIAELLSNDLSFWSYGNAPTQELFGLTTRDLIDDLKAKTLLTDITLAAASFYFESPKTRRVVQALKPFFRDGSVMFFVAEDVESYRHHAEQKRRKSVLRCYRDRVTRRELAGELESLRLIVRRPADSISDAIAARWTADIARSAAGTLGEAIAKTYPDLPERGDIARRITAIAFRREADFIWEYVEPRLRNITTRIEIIRRARQRLADFYSEVTEETLGVALTTVDRLALQTPLLLKALRTLGVAGHFRALTPGQVLDLRQSSEWLAFRMVWRDLVEATEGRIETVLPLLLAAEPRIVTDSRAAAAARRLVRRAASKIEPDPVTTMREVFKACEMLPIQAVIEAIQNPLGEIVRRRKQRMYRAEEVTVGVVTALPVERAAVELVLDNVRDLSLQVLNVTRAFTIGELPGRGEQRHVVAVDMCGVGNNSASSRATSLLHAFPNMRNVLMVGIAGGIPCGTDPKRHVRLGDVVVSDRRGVIQYDMVKDVQWDEIPNHHPTPPSVELLDAVAYMTSRELHSDTSWLAHLDRVADLRGVARPSEATDVFCDRDGRECSTHPHDPDREVGKPRMFMGPIASANRLLRNYIYRDQLSERYRVLAVEMEGAGIADATWQVGRGYLVVRGICDYCDFKKGDLWHPYAAAVAAAAMRGILAAAPAHLSRRR